MSNQSSGILAIIVVCVVLWAFYGDKTPSPVEQTRNAVHMSGPQKGWENRKTGEFYSNSTIDWAIRGKINRGLSPQEAAAEVRAECRRVY